MKGNKRLIRACSSQKNKKTAFPPPTTYQLLRKGYSAGKWIGSLATITESSFNSAMLSFIFYAIKPKIIWYNLVVFIFFYY
ncbi:hypothetical protein COK38_24960 [Bacillus cereus]|uniref:Uncharacterized protein n=1 Tax=Bacillus cereus TaxID=1396 RepID=A0AA44TDM6_BACCE|nr:hypothetical protein COJ55_11760 [Bacillus cereus]PFR89118.1 hypothetical protein COK38_24960 [Bacillus cereus]